ncbi:SRPBCC domain-containing protein [Algoriphagus jejuensis]|uniref:SRPBCC domain-containing protein n=1 Tax=Algoriphagus jejuensis TaxID=419934 RepID=A0ABN1MY62_9BACT
MKNENYSTSILLDQSPESVFQAINDVRGWWSEEIDGPTDQVGEEWFYHYKDIHLCKMKVLEMVPAKKVVWKVIDNSFNFIVDKGEWVGNRIIFEISHVGDQTKLTFTQEGLTSFDECFEVCRDGWDNYVNNSLFKVITTGKGEPNPKEGKGFNKELADRWDLR